MALPAELHCSTWCADRALAFLEEAAAGDEPFFCILGDTILKADYADLVIVAQLHDGVAGGIDASRISALSRLGLTYDAEDGAIEVLKDASAAIHDSRLLLSA